jgi:hypothetical protein
MIWQTWLVGGIVGAVTASTASALGAPWWLQLAAVIANSVAVGTGMTRVRG